MSSLSLGSVDYVVISIMLAISTAIGLYFRFTGGRQRTTGEFFLAGKEMNVIPVAFSIMATNLSSSSIMGRPAEIYLFGTQYFAFLIGQPLGIVFASHFFLPVFFNTKFSSLYEYLEKRFGRSTRTILSSLFTIQTIFYMAVVVYAPSLALNAVTGLPIWGSLIAISMVTTLYSFLGGLKAVIWTDVFQAILMFLCVYAVVIKATLEVGGLQKSLEIANNGGRLIFFDFSPSLFQRYTFWNSFAAGFTYGIGTYSFTQLQVQRLSSLGTIERAKRSLWASLPLIFVFHFGCVWAGVALYSLFHDCDPFLRPSNTILTKADQLLPYAALMLYKNIPGLSGLCIAGVFSSSLSTISSAINSLAMVTIEDFIRPFCLCKSLSEKWMTYLAKAAVIVYGLICLLLTFIVANFRGIIEAGYFLYGMIAGPVQGVFYLGLLTTTANESGTLIGLFSGLTFTSWWAVGAYLARYKVPQLHRSISGCTEMNFSNNTQYTTPIPKIPQNPEDIFPLYRVSFLWHAFFASIVVVIVGYLSSLIIARFKEHKDVQPHLLSPLVRKWLIKSQGKKASYEMQHVEETEDFIINKNNVTIT